MKSLQKLSYFSFSTFLVVGGRRLVMKKFLAILILGLLFSSNSYSSDTDGRWRGLVSCEWNPFYKLNK